MTHPSETLIRIPGARAAGAAPLTRDTLSTLLLGIVDETTGYPRDMVGLDQNLEAHLGIDSIKRIEIVAALKAGKAEVRADLHTMDASIKTWMVATMVGLFIGFGGLFLAMSNALKPSPQIVSTTPATLVSFGVGLAVVGRLRKRPAGTGASAV